MFCTRCGLFRWEQIGRDAAGDVDGFADSVGECIGEFDLEPQCDRDAVRVRYGHADPGSERAAVECGYFGPVAAARQRRRIHL
jgi:hypothetical protein